MSNLSPSQLSSRTTGEADYVRTGRLPLGALTALSMTGFLALLTEIMPAGLLRQIGQDFHISESVAGQLVTAFAVGSIVTVIPLMTYTQHISRRKLLLAAILAMTVANAGTAMSENLLVTLLLRFIAGIGGAMVWALLVGYAQRLAPPHLTGRAIALTALGAPLALSIGAPIGTLIGELWGWRAAFWSVTALPLLLSVWIWLRVPAISSEAKTSRYFLKDTLRLPGLLSVYVITFIVVASHNELYTYISPYLAKHGFSEFVGLILLLFGGASIIGVWLAGLIVDRSLSRALQAMILVFILATAILVLTGGESVFFAPAIAIWGVAIGGAPTLLQTASARFAGNATDVAQAIFVTTWNLAVFAGGALGGIVLYATDANRLPLAAAIMLFPALLITLYSIRARLA